MSLTLTRLTGIALYQDLGRPGYADLGVSPSGAANRSALAAANTALGNAPGAPAIELTGTCELLAGADVLLCTSGAPVEFGGHPVSGGRVSEQGVCTLVRVLAGERVTVTSRGIRTYLAVRGGFDAPRVLGSASYDTLSGLGPAPLKGGATLPVREEVAPLRTVDPRRLPAVGAPGSLLLASVYPGPRADWAEDLDVLFDHEYTVGDQADRVGVRLAGPRLARKREEELASEGLVRGAIQLPPSGEPLIFGPDHPTTGGYPVIGVLAPAAADALAHAVPGQAVRFRRARLRG